MLSVFSKASSIVAKAAVICGAALLSANFFGINACAADISAADIYSTTVEKINDSYPNRHCLQFVEEIYQLLGGDRPYDCCASYSGDKYIVSTSMDDIPVGATVYFGNCGGGYCPACGNRFYGHTGIYIGDGLFVHATGGTVQASSLSSWANIYRGYGFCGDFNLTDSRSASSNNPFGYLDFAGAEGNKIRVRGWTFDADDYSQNLDIHVYVGAPACQGEAHVGVANTYRPDVDQAFAGSGSNHGYDFTFQTKLKGRQKVYVYALNAKGTGGDNILLGEATVDIGGTSEINWPITGQKYMIAYTISNKNNTVAYSGPDLKTKIGTIYASDDVRVYSIEDDYAYVSYPVSNNRRKYAYIPISAIAGNDSPCECKTASSSIKTYSRPGGTRVGSIYSGDVVYKVAESGKYTQIVYNIGSASDTTCYRMAWILTSEYSSLIG